MNLKPLDEKKKKDVNYDKSQTVKDLKMGETRDQWLQFQHLPKWVWQKQANSIWRTFGMIFWYLYLPSQKKNKKAKAFSPVKSC